MFCFLFILAVVAQWWVNKIRTDPQQDEQKVQWRFPGFFLFSFFFIGSHLNQYSPFNFPKSNKQECMNVWKLTFELVVIYAPGHLLSEQMEPK